VAGSTDGAGQWSDSSNAQTINKNLFGSFFVFFKMVLKIKSDDQKIIHNK